MNNILGSGLIAVVAGGVVAVLAFVPFVAVSYRRRGGLSVPRTLLWIAAAVYFWAIWSYTLWPFPLEDQYVCAGLNLEPFHFIDDIVTELAESQSRGLAAVMQVVFNTVLFLPLGFLLRVLGGRGVVVAGLTGLAVSGVVETSQLTAVWGVFPCPYRVFDVDDLMANTAGAVIGSAIALIVPAEHRGAERPADADVPRPVTRRRRFLGIACDVLGFSLVSLAAWVTAEMVFETVFPESGRGHAVAGILSISAPVVLWLLVVLATGRSIGDLATRVRYTDGLLPAWLARPLRFVLGVGGVSLLLALGLPTAVIGLALALGLLVLLPVWPDGRGLLGWIGRRRLVDDRAATVDSPSRV
ncbi:VanZ family protein [Microbacterium enclense]|uniref:VanZ family protein n=1 Tax=Microbacterium enclense TaxID=993073 RepID=UPI0036DD0F9A